MKEAGCVFDIAYTSVLQARDQDALASRSTSWICSGFRSSKHWRLNERHYGALQGLNKAETAAKHGEAQVKIWRRSYDIPPPPLSPDDERHPAQRSALRDAEAERDAARPSR